MMDRKPNFKVGGGGENRNVDPAEPPFQMCRTECKTGHTISNFDLPICTALQNEFPFDAFIQCRLADLPSAQDVA